MGRSDPREKIFGISLYNYGKKFPFDCMFVANGNCKTLSRESKLISVSPSMNYAG